MNGDTSREIATNVFEKKAGEYKKFEIVEFPEKERSQSTGVMFGI